MRHHDTSMANRWVMNSLAGIMVLLGLAIAGLPHCQAQMRYSGGFIPTRHNRPNPTPQPAAPPAPAATTPPSYYPDNDGGYPAFYPGSVPTRPLRPAVLLPNGVLPADLPWNRADFEDYNDTPALPGDGSLFQPKRFSLTATSLPPAPAAVRSENALLIAHLPEHALLWVEGALTRSLGRTRYFQSPPLLAGRKYNYRVSAAWIEDGRWVSQTRMVPVQAGAIQALYLRPAPEVPAKAARNSYPK